MNSWIIQVIFSRLVVTIFKCHIERVSPAKKSIVRVIDGLSIQEKPIVGAPGWVPNVFTDLQERAAARPYMFFVL